jgi:hypothetical protein
MGLLLMLMGADKPSKHGCVNSDERLFIESRSVSRDECVA